LSRPEIVKKLWKYIKGNDLQDPADRRFILCDEKLKTIFDQDRVNSFGMNRDLSAHLTKKPEEDPPVPCLTLDEHKTSPAETVVTAEDVVTPKEGEHIATTLSTTTTLFTSAV
ncbi:hypothetical protein DFQ30_009714, partial [Apophysomyces sp. BC1015]